MRMPRIKRAGLAGEFARTQQNLGLVGAEVLQRIRRTAEAVLEHEAEVPPEAIVHARAALGMVEVAQAAFDAASTATAGAVLRLAEIDRIVRA